MSCANFTEAGQLRNIDVGLLLNCPMIAKESTASSIAWQKRPVWKGPSKLVQVGRFDRLASVGSRTTETSHGAVCIRCKGTGEVGPARGRDTRYV